LYLITSPMFNQVNLKLGREEKELIIICKGLSEINKYIISASLNGEPLKKSWFSHTEIKNGGIIEFRMGAKPTSWDTEEYPRK
ncbi:MAG: glycoside hydrolase family 92 protein, partial [Pedobacter sp.]|nr:glycoside hydrolase family 92 protein [Pedobacter sp.]